MGAPSAMDEKSALLLLLLFGVVVPVLGLGRLDRPAGIVRNGPSSSLSRNESSVLSCSADVPTEARSQAWCRSVSRMMEDEEVGLERMSLSVTSLSSSCMSESVWAARRVRKYLALR